MPQRSRRILVVGHREAEDSPLVSLLCDAGFSVDQAATVDEVIQTGEVRPAVILFDTDMANGDIAEIGRGLRAHPKTAFVPQLRPSAPYSEDPEADHGGADAYFTRPLNPVELLATVRSLLRLRAAEEFANFSARQWQTTFDAISDAICLVDRNGRILRHNRAMALLAGQPDGSVNGRLYADVLHDNVGDSGSPATRAVWETGTRKIREAHARERWLRILTDPVSDSDGTIIGTVHILSDITAQRESAIRQRAFLRDLLANVTEGKLTLVESAADLPRPLHNGQEPIRLAPQNLSRLRRHVRELGTQEGFAPERWQDLETATGEAAMNAVVHAGGGFARTGTDGDGTIQVWIQDAGPGIAMDYLHRATLERGYTTSGTMGHGFWMMLQTADRLWLLTGADGTTVVLEQDRDKREPSWLNRF